MSGFPTLPSPKLLGVPKIDNSTGSSQHDAIVEVLKDWDVESQVIALVFDTTASNTGRFKGCATSLEKSRGCAVLWCACRHHVYEIHVQHVAEEVIGERNQPSETLFKHFQTEFPNLNQETEVITQMILMENVMLIASVTLNEFE